MYASETDRQFFVKLHRTRSPHYDFRLEHAGVLMSWVIPEGPCLDPTQERSAKFVDDHEIKYGSLERVIPAGQYGAGPVMLWDHGIWLPCQNVDQGLREGRLEFYLRGSKLQGVWSLKWKPNRRGEWLLTKKWDAEARSLAEMDILVEQPTSVLTGRTVDEIAAEPRRFVSVKKLQRNTRSKKNRSAPNQLFLFSDAPEL